MDDGHVKLPTRPKSKSSTTGRNRRRTTTTVNPTLTETEESDTSLQLPSDTEALVLTTPIKPHPNQLPESSFSRRLWAAIANSPKWIREAGRDSESDESDTSEIEVISTSLDRKRINERYMLRESINAPVRFTIDYKTGKRSKVIRQPDGKEVVIPMNSSDEEGLESEVDEDDSDAWNPSKDTTGVVGRKSTGKKRRKSRRRTMEETVVVKQEVEEREYYPQVDNPFEEFIQPLPKKTWDKHVWRLAKAYVATPLRRLARWSLSQLAFGLFAAWWFLSHVFWLFMEAAVYRPFAWWKGGVNKTPTGMLRALLILVPFMLFGYFGKRLVLVDHAPDVIPPPSVPWTFKAPQLESFRIPVVSLPNPLSWLRSSNQDASLVARLEQLEAKINGASDLKDVHDLKAELRHVTQQVAQLYQKQSELEHKHVPIQGSPEVMEHLASLVGSAQLQGMEEHVNAMVHASVLKALELAITQGKAVDLPTLRSELYKHDAHSSGARLDVSRTDERKLRDFVQSQVDRARADDLAIPDYALYATGARVMPKLTSDTFIATPSGYLSWMLYSILPSWLMTPDTLNHHSPDITLFPTHNIGECWPMQGSEGSLGVLLPKAIVVEGFTVEHVDKRIALDVSSAPKEMELWAIAQDTDTSGWELDPTYGIQMRRLAVIQYDKEQPQGPVQVFWVDDEHRGIRVRAIQLRILSNHGNPHWTCLYRLRIHGHT
jgi:hypothetical protein